VAIQAPGANIVDINIITKDELFFFYKNGCSKIGVIFLNKLAGLNLFFYIILSPLITTTTIVFIIIMAYFITNLHMHRLQS